MGVGGKNVIRLHLPSTRSWLTCHNIAAILWSCPMFSQPLCCQQSSSDAAQWKIRHLIKETSAVAFWTTCRPILITLHHGKAPVLAGGTATSQIERQGSVLLAFFFFFFFLV